MKIFYYSIATAPFIVSFVKKDITYLFLVIYFFMSAICYLIYRFDKKRAINSGDRVPEVRLHFIELLGGWPGGLIAQQIYRHKTIKKSYQLKFWFIVSLHFVIWFDFLNSFQYTKLTLEFIRSYLT